MTRAQHLVFAQERALEYLPDANMAMTSFISDLKNHEELADHSVIELMFMHAMTGQLSERNCRDFITGTN